MYHTICNERWELFMAQYAAETESRAAAAAPVIANPGPLGLSAFALTTFVLSSVNAGWFPGATSIVIALALFYGGIAQLCAGMWEFKTGNTFGATAFSSYGAFWLSLGFTLLPGSGILASIGKTAPQALGLFLLGWTIFTAIMFIGTLRSNAALIAVFAVLALTFLSLTIGFLTGSSTFITLGGWLGVITAILAWYTALAGLLSSSKSAFSLPVGPIA
jgi:succinate-acetate transporter protein